MTPIEPDYETIFQVPPDENVASILLSLKNIKENNTENEFYDSSNSMEVQQRDDFHFTSSVSSNLNQLEEPIFLGLPSDSSYLSETHSFLRSTCIEVFQVSQEDMLNRRLGKGRNIAVGQVGIRCVFCRNAPIKSRAPQAISFPSQLNGLYTAVMMMQRRHLNECRYIPDDVKGCMNDIRQNNKDCCNTPGRQKYWQDSAILIGLKDTEQGITFAPVDTTTQEYEMALQSISGNMQHKRRKGSRLFSTNCEGDQVTRQQIFVRPRKLLKSTRMDSFEDDCQPSIVSISSSLSSSAGDDHLAGTNLALPEDKGLVPDHLHFAFEQMTKCYLAKSDRIGTYRDRPTGFPGMSCMHCGGQPGFGKYFPSSIQGLAQTTTTQTILKHLESKCSGCPQSVRVTLQSLIREWKATKNRNERPKYGSRKTFFKRIWSRLHDNNAQL